MSLLPDDRMARLDAAMADSHRIIADALDAHVDGHTIVARALLFSGGNDSTTLGHFLRKRLTHAIHINTGIGIEATRQHVRDTCEAWGLPLIEKSPPPGSTYRELILDQGFPGPAHHFKMYQRLKERGLRAARRELVSDPRKERAIFFAGRRRAESQRRQVIVEHEREGSAIWISPIANWTAEDLNTYRALHNVPRNEVSDLIHMSGECLCGAFAKRGELDEIGDWFPDVVAEIRALEAEAEALGKKHCRWGWGADQRITAAEKSGPLCLLVRHVTPTRPIRNDNGGNRMTQHVEHDEWTAAVYRELARSGPATLPVTTEERLRATITALANECDRALDLIQQLRLERDAAHREVVEERSSLRAQVEEWRDYAEANERGGYMRDEHRVGQAYGYERVLDLLEATP